MTWKCEICTLINENDLFLCCGVCGTERPKQIESSIIIGTQSKLNTSPERTRTEEEAITSEQRFHSSSSSSITTPPPPLLTSSKKRPRYEKQEKTSKQPAAAPLQLKRFPAFPILLKQQYDHNARPITDDEVSKYAPVTISRSVLPSALADALLRKFLRDSNLDEDGGGGWHRGCWTVHGKRHDNPRTTRSFLLRPPNESTSGEYSELGGGMSFLEEEENTSSSDGSGKSKSFPACAELLEATKIITKIVRQTNPRAHWNPTLAFGNCYKDGNESVGYHSDFLLSLGPRPIIAGLNLGATRIFRLRRVVVEEEGGKTDATTPSTTNTTTVSIPAPHNSLIIMKCDAQESWHHSVPKCANTSIREHSISGKFRFNLTFRMERPEFSSKLHDVRCFCKRKPVLKSSLRAGYYLCCNPAGGDASTKKCNFWTRCEIAEQEADRLRGIENGGISSQVCDKNEQ